MIADLKPYPAMKDSGVEWLGAVPEHWEVRRLRNTSEMRVSNVDKHAKDDEQPVRLCNYVDVYKNERIRSGMAFMRATATTDEIERFRLQPGDVLITKDSEAWNDIGVPALVEDTQDDIVSGYHLALLRPFPERVDGGYLFRALQSTAVTYQFHVEANGVTRYGLSHSAIKSVWLPLAPLPEQSAIVRFLDHADRRIRRYIHAKQKLVKLLEEQKQALIHQSVTRGLDPNVRLKPSGVEWLGDVPEHWERARLKAFLLRPMRNGLFKKKDAFGSGAPLVNVADIYHDSFQIDPASLDRVQTTPDELRTYQVRTGDLFFVRSSLKLEGTGRSAVAIDCEAGSVFECHLVQGRPDPRRAVARFLAFQLNSFSLRHYMISRANVVTMATVSQGVLASCPVFLPSISEQEGLLKQIDGECARVAATHDRAHREIDLLHEYRTRLIADVVTGKLDVRKAAAGLPDEVEEPDPFDETGALTDGEEEPSDGFDNTPEEAVV